MVSMLMSCQNIKTLLSTPTAACPASSSFGLCRDEDDASSSSSSSSAGCFDLPQSCYPRLLVSATPCSLASSSAASCFSSLPRNCQVEIFKYLDLKSLCNSAEVCKEWRSVARDGMLWDIFNSQKLIECRSEISLTLDSLVSLSTRAFADKSSTERLEFLKNTVEMARDYTDKQQSTRAWRYCRAQQSVFALFTAFYAQLLDIRKMLTELSSGRYLITCNFDIFETALRRYCEELRSLVPSDPVQAREFDRPSPNGDWDNIPDPRVVRGIQDSGAMNAWCAAFGPFTALVPFEMFYRKVICVAFPRETKDGRFADHLRYHINFPRDGITSTWRFQNLLSTFGPWHSLAANFTKFALNSGFVGLVNMIKAEELLIENLPSLTKNTVLIRYSRRQPEVLAFTSIDLRTRRIEHRRNMDRNGRVIPIAEFLEKVFPGYELAKLGLDDAVTKVQNTFTFARYANPYTYSHYHTALSPVHTSAIPTGAAAAAPQHSSITAGPSSHS